MKKPKPKPKHAASRLRNAGPPRPTTPRPARVAETPETPGWHLLHTAGGALGASLAGALATRYGFHPQTIATVITGVSGGVAWKGTTQRARSIAAGAASAGGSQLLLLTLKANEAPKPTANQNQAPLVAARTKNADLGALPAGALDAAFERARAELALTHDSYAHEAPSFAA